MLAFKPTAKTLSGSLLGADKRRASVLLLDLTVAFDTSVYVILPDRLKRCAAMKPL